MTWSARIQKHYSENWGSPGRIVQFERGPTSDLFPDFGVLEFAPTASRTMWTYATVCMSSAEEKSPIELHLYSHEKSIATVELLYAVAHFHQSGTFLGLGHTVNFGKPWQGQSKCSHGLISLPYLDGPKLENLWMDRSILIKCYWLIPVTPEEVAFKRDYGLERLEELFEQKSFDYLDPDRESVC